MHIFFDPVDKSACFYRHKKRTTSEYMHHSFVTKKIIPLKALILQVLQPVIIFAISFLKSQVT